MKNSKKSNMENTATPAPATPAPATPAPAEEKQQKEPKLSPIETKKKALLERGFTALPEENNWDNWVGFSATSKGGQKFQVYVNSRRTDSVQVFSNSVFPGCLQKRQEKEVEVETTVKGADGKEEKKIEKKKTKEMAPFLDEFGFYCNYKSSWEDVDKLLA